MALIELLDPESSPELRELYSASRYSNESPYRRARLHNPEVLQAQTEYQEKLFEAGPVDEALYEYIMVTVAQTNDCDYCAGSHRLKLMSIAGVSEDVIDELAEGDYGTLSAEERAVVEFAEQVTDDPHRVTEAHIEALREVGYDESGIIQLLALIGTCNTSNMIVSSLGITPEDRSGELPTY
jgi:uncharacterized peroxidase-related enzyme